MGKLSIFLKIIQVVKNWQIVLLVYFGLYKKEFFYLNLKNGLKIKLRTKSTDLQAFANVWILKEYEMQGFEIMKNDVIIDIGGHIGLFSLYASLKNPNGKIISIEPHPQNFLLLKENLECNGFPNIKILNSAVSNSNKNIELFIDSLDDSAHSIHGVGKNSIQIKGITLHQIMNENRITNCNMLKMDCEGAEFEIINSLSDEEILKIEKICLEYHLKNDNLFLLESMKNRLKKLEYDVDIKPTNNFLGMLYARK
jgi:FkbM family methyltransferase